MLSLIAHDCYACKRPSCTMANVLGKEIPLCDLCTRKATANRAYFERTILDRMLRSCAGCDAPPDETTHTHGALKYCSCCAAERGIDGGSPAPGFESWLATH